MSFSNFMLNRRLKWSSAIFQITETIICGVCEAGSSRSTQVSGSGSRLNLGDDRALVDDTAAHPALPPSLSLSHTHTARASAARPCPTRHTWTSGVPRDYRDSAAMERGSGACLGDDRALVDDAAAHPERLYLTSSVDKAVLQKSIPVQIRQLITTIKNKLTDLWGSGLSETN